MSTPIGVSTTPPASPPKLTAQDLETLLDLVHFAILADDDYVGFAPETAFARTCQERRPRYVQVQRKLRKLRGIEEA